MKQVKRGLIITALIFGLSGTQVAMADSCPAFLDHEQRKLHSTDTVNLCDLAAGKPMLVVTGAEANPVFRAINEQSQPPRWNFTKYVIDRSGTVVDSFPSRVRPQDPELIDAVESVL